MEHSFAGGDHPATPRNKCRVFSVMDDTVRLAFAARAANATPNAGSGPAEMEWQPREAAESQHKREMPGNME